MKNNGLLLLALAYVALFGLKVDVGEHHQIGPMSQCKPIDIPVLTAPPVIPVIDKDNLENKDFVIRTLIKHIRSQNEYINTSNKQASRIYNTYVECAIE